MRNKLLSVETDAYSSIQNAGTDSINYQFVYIKTKRIDIHISNNATIKVFADYIFGKKQNGAIELFDILPNTPENIDELGKKLKEQGMKGADMFILSARTHKIFDTIKNSLLQYYPDAKYQWCAGSIYEELLRFIGRSSAAGFENMLYQSSKRMAQSLLDDNSKQIPEYICKNLKNQFDSFQEYYQYLPQDRVLICTTIIVEYVHIIITNLINAIPFTNTEIALGYIKILSQRVLNNGKNLIPNWEQLTLPVRTKS
jgi:hypothetical protein